MTRQNSTTDQKLASEEVKGRLVLCDPACALPYGHAVPALTHFRKKFSGRYHNVEAVAATCLSEIVAQQAGLVRGFTYLYDQYVNVQGENYIDIIRDNPSYNKELADPLEGISSIEALHLINDRGLSANDDILLPGADFYGALGFINAIATLPAENRPRLLLRFIGVFDTATDAHPQPAVELHLRIRNAIKLGLNIEIAAETPRYADFLSSKLECYVEVCPYPSTSNLVPLPKHEVFRVLCAGSARLDKGFHHLLGIAKTLALSPGVRSVQITTQTLPFEQNASWDDYTSQLYATPGVVLLEPAITSGEIDHLYRECNIILLPYSEDEYVMRGSAVMMEAASIGRLCITLKGTAFSQQVEYYGLGTLVENIEAIPEEIERLSQEDSTLQQHRIVQARSRFFNDIECAYARWLARKVVRA